MHLYFNMVFLKICEKKKKRKNEKKMSSFLRAHVSRMAGVIYFKSGT